MLPKVVLEKEKNERITVPTDVVMISCMIIDIKKGLIKNKLENETIDLSRLQEI